MLAYLLTSWLYFPVRTLAFMISADYIYLSIYLSIALVNFGRFFSFLICTQSIGLWG
jgi:hypothetical protein